MVSAKKKSGLIISGTLTTLICVAMNFVLIPKIEASTNGIRCFDMNFGYSPADAQSFLESISKISRHIYLCFQLPLDFIYPICYCVFFVLLIAVLSKKKTKLVIVPVILALFDYTENIFTVIFLNKPITNTNIFYVSSAVTAVKTVLMYMCFLIIISLIFKRIKQNKAKKNPAAD